MAPNSAKKEFSFHTRRLAWAELTSQKNFTANVVIVGGGIVGAGILRELALQRFPKVFLFEKNDFASGTSGNSSKLIHAGLRYLEQSWLALKAFRIRDALRQFRFVWSASWERKILGRLAPHLVKPKRIHFVLRAGDNRAPLSVAFGIWVYYLMQILQGQFFPPPRFGFSKKRRKKLAPELDHEKTSLVFSFWDSETDDARLVIENLQKANDLGATALNYVEVTRYTRHSRESGNPGFEPKETFGNDGPILVSLRNRETGEETTISAKLLINATGAFVDELREKSKDLASGRGKFLDRVAGSHIDIYPALTNKSYYVTATDERLVFFLKRNEDGLEYTRVGTTERPLKKNESSDDPRPTKEEFDYLANLVRFFIPSAKLNQKNIIKTDSGIRPLRAQIAGRPFDKSREHDIIIDRDVIHVIGVKLTDFRRVASEILKIFPWWRIGVKIENPARSKSECYRSTPEKTGNTYEEEGMGQIIRHTMPLHWKDYLLRRRGLAPLVMQRLNPDLLEREFEVMSQILGWDDRTKKSERSGGGI